MTHNIPCGGIIRKCCIGMVAIVLFVFTAEATYVFKDCIKNDSRLVVANTTFSNVVDKAMSGGLWVRDIIPDDSNMSDPAAIFGCAHVKSSTDNGSGFVVMFSSRNSLRFNLFGKTENGERKSYSDVLGTNDIGWCHDGKWHFIMFTCDCDKGEAKLYLDGTLLTTLTHDLANISPERSYAFGGGLGAKGESDSAIKDSYGAGWIGYFAEATVWNRALTDEEVAELATRRVKYDSSGLLAYWPCNEASGNPVNWAANVIKRADGKDVTAYARAVDYYDDPDFFSMPSGYFVVTPEYAAAHSYVMAADCPANTLAKPATNIQYALDKATTAGTTVNLLPGTYYPESPLTIKCNSLVMRSYSPTTGGYDRMGTVIDGSRMISDELGLIDNNGKTKPQFHALTFCNTVNNRAIYLKSAGAFQVVDCSFTNLTITSGDGGAGVYCYTCDGGAISNCLFKSCKGENGGGVFTVQMADRSETDLITIYDSQFENCLATKQGGGLYSARHNDVIGCTFRNCRVEATASGSRKGGSLRVGSFSVISDCLFTGATGVKVLSGSFCYGGIIEADRGNVVITNCLITGCSYTEDTFGAIHFSSLGSNLVVNTICTNNSINSQFVFAEGTVPNTVIRNCLVAKAGGSGPTCLVTGHDSPLVCVENVTCDLDSVMERSGSFSTNMFVNSILCGTFTASSDTHVNIVSNCCLAVATTGAKDSGVVVGSPRFVDAEHGDYSLKHSSPARDKALFLPWITTSATDLAGNPRVVTDGKTLAENPNAKPDMGCYECLLEPTGMMLLVR